MRELHGLTFIFDDLSELKRKALLFDTFHVWARNGIELTDHADFDFLQSNRIIVEVDADFRAFVRSGALDESLANPTQRYLDGLTDCISFFLSGRTFRQSGSDVVPILSVPLTDFLVMREEMRSLEIAMQILEPPNVGISTDVLTVGLKGLPTPNESCAWQDILDFKAEFHEKLWAFRRFLRTLGTKQQTEAEIRDEIEWRLNEYQNEMDRLKIKRSVSFMESYVIPSVEALENFKPSSFLKGLVSIRKRKIQLLDDEAKAVGRECAYMLDARKRFGTLS